MIEAKTLGEFLLSQRLLGEDGSGSVRAFVALWWVKQYDLPNLFQLVDERFEGNPTPGVLRLLVQILKQRYAEHAVKSMDANLAAGPVEHRSPSQPVPVFEPTKDPFNVLLTAVPSGDLLGSPVHWRKSGASGGAGLNNLSSLPGQQKCVVAVILAQEVDVENK